MIYGKKCPQIPISLGALPSSYEESLSFLEILQILRCKVDEICNYLQNISVENIDKLIDEKFNELKSYVDLQDNMIYNYIDNQITDSKNYTDTKVNDCINQLTNLINQKVIFILDYIEKNNIILKNEIQEEIDELKEEINDIIINGINVYDPTTGQYNNIQDVIYNLYKYLRYYGITASEFDTLNLTCETFDNLQITARNFDLYSKNILVTNFYHYMYSPFTGKITSITDVINQLADFHKTSITANGFDELLLTAESFDNKDLTAFEFDWHGGTLLAS